MQNVWEFNYKFIEVSHVKIGIQLLKLWNLEVQFWAPFWKTLQIRKNWTWNGLKFEPSLKRKILMSTIREFNHKFKKVSHV